MRIFFHFKSSSLSIDNANIRKKFLSFIKKAFESSSSDIFCSIFKEKKFKPYVFSPFFGRKFKEGVVGPEISFIFCTGSYDILSHFWNGLLELKRKKEDYIKIGESIYNLEYINLIKGKTIKCNKVIFKTIGVCILTDPEKEAKNFNEWFLVPSIKNLEYFNEILLKRTLKRMEFLKKGVKDKKLEFIPGKIKECIIPHYGGYLKGFKGNFQLKGSPEVLQFLYDYGLGVRTGQGFGLLEVEKEL